MQCTSNELRTHTHTHTIVSDDKSHEVNYQINNARHVAIATSNKKEL